MRGRLKQLLPVLAALGALTAAICLLVTSHRLRALRTETRQTRLSVEETLAKLGALHPASLEDAAFRRAVEQALHAPHVATVWLLAPDGRFVQATGSTARSTPLPGTAEELATDDTRRVLEALPTNALTKEQRTWVLAASAIGREGGHNDILRHFLRPVASPDGTTVALIGVAYSASDVEPGLGAVLSVLGVVAGLVVYWLALPLWVLLDSRERGERAWAWAAFVLIANLVGLVAYLLGRAPTRTSSPF